jgi:hypothetical protein
MSEASSEKVTEKVPWLLVVLLSIFLGAFGIAWLQFLPSNLFSYYNFGSILCVMNLTAAPFIVLIFTSIFSKLTGKKVSLVTLTYLYVIAYTSSWYVSTYCPFEFADITSSRHMNSDWSSAYVASFMAPPMDITSQLVTGHVAVPWGDWLPAIMYHWSLFILLGFFYISVATLFRRLWVDIERVPFPHALLAYELVRRMPQEKKSLMEKLGRPFLVGIVLGLVFQIPIFMQAIFPWFPDIYGWRTLCSSGQWYVTGASPFAGIAGLSAFQEHPAAVAMAYLAPLSISFNAWFWQMIYMVLMQLAYVTGSYTGIETEGGCGRAWCSPSGLREPPFKFQAISYGGGLIGLTVMGLILNRKYIVETVRAALAKHSSRLEVEKNEALTYRSTYLLLGACFVLLVVLFMLDGMGFVPALLVPISYFLFWMANARLFGLAGMQARGGDHGNTLLRLLLWPQAPDPPTREYVLAAYYSRRGMDSPDAIQGGSIFSGFASYKMASLTGTSNSSVLKVMLTSTIIVPVVVLITYIWVCYGYGGSVLPGNGGQVRTQQFFNWSNPSSYNLVPSVEPLAPYVILGFLIVAALDILHARFVWFPFEPVGFIIGTSFISVLWGYWGSFLIAWALKIITLRLGGSKLYENLGVPIAGGFITGYMIAVILGGTIGVLRFFVPF